MNNEPVAWAIKSDGDFTEIGWSDEVLHEVEEWYTAQGWQYEYIPLYTHPAKEHDLGISHAIGFDDGFKAGMQRAVEMNVVKTLTDEEIAKLADDILGYQIYGYKESGVYEFSRAILRKAQE